MKHVVTSAAEAETAGIFYNCQTAISIKQMLEALGHKQTATPVKTDNKTASSFVTDTFKQKRSKAWDVRYHWLSEQQKLRFFFIYWAKGVLNLADYHTKHHPPIHHKKVRKKYILQNFNIMQNNNYIRYGTPARVCSYTDRPTVCRQVPEKDNGHLTVTNRLVRSHKIT